MLLPFLLFNAPSPTETYTLSLHDALPIYAEPVTMRIGIGEDSELQHLVGRMSDAGHNIGRAERRLLDFGVIVLRIAFERSEEHTSELQSRGHLVCRLLLEKKKRKMNRN